MQHKILLRMNKVMLAFTAWIFISVLVCLHTNPARGAELIQTIEAIKPSIVGIATFQKMRSPPVNFMGTGFVVGDGTLVVTNAHVAPESVDSEKMESLVVITAKGNETELRGAVKIAVDKEHDLALLKISGQALPALTLADSSTAREGQMLAFTGFPISMVLGFHPVTHRGMLSSITPIILPAFSANRLDAKMLTQLKKTPFSIFQLDGTAYPGNSGSPLFDPETGNVFGIINMVFVKGLKETALTNPSGITYAIPSNYLRDLLLRR